MNEPTAVFWREIGQRFGTHDPVREGIAALLLLLLLGAMALAWIIHEWRTRQRHLDSRPALFEELSRVHQLPMTEQRLLREFADELKEPFPDRFFVRPDLFESAAAAWGKGRSDEEVQFAERLRERLFGPAWSQTDLRTHESRQ